MLYECVILNDSTCTTINKAYYMHRAPGLTALNVLLHIQCVVFRMCISAVVFSKSLLP